MGNLFHMMICVVGIDTIVKRERVNDRKNFIYKKMELFGSGSI